MLASKNKNYHPYGNTFAEESYYDIDDKNLKTVEKTYLIPSEKDLELFCIDVIDDFVDSLNTISYFDIHKKEKKSAIEELIECAKLKSDGSYFNVFSPVYESTTGEELDTAKFNVNFNLSNDDKYLVLTFEPESICW